MILRLSEQAQRDVNAQIDWLAEHSPRSAEEALEEIFRVFDLLEEFPTSESLPSEAGAKKA